MPEAERLEACTCCRPECSCMDCEACSDPAVEVAKRHDARPSRAAKTGPPKHLD